MKKINEVCIQERKVAEAEEGDDGVEATNNEPFINVDQLELGVATKGMRATSLDVRNRGREAVR